MAYPKQELTPDSESSHDEKSTHDAVISSKFPENDAVSSSNSSENEFHLQHGVEVAEALRKSWTKKPLIIAYASLFFSALITAFATYSSTTYIPYATSAFKAHSMLATAAVAYKIIRVVIYPIMAKLSDVFGRAEGFSFAILFTTVSFITFAASQNIQTYVAGNFFDAVGDVSYIIMQQIFIADTTNLLNRGLWASLPEAVTSIPTVYLGSIVGEAMLEHSTWRWGYGMWAIIFPICTAPLVGVMFWLHKKAKANGEIKTIAILKDVKKSDPWYRKVYQLLWIELDIFGGFLLAAGLTLTLIPINIAGDDNTNRWKQAHNIVMLILGILICFAFGIWECLWAKNPFVPYRMVKKFTVFAACAIVFFDTLNYACFNTFFPSYLQVAGHYSAGVSTRIDNSTKVSFQISSVVVGLLMKYTKRAKIYCYIGVPMLILGQGIMIYLVNMNNGNVANEASFIAAKAVFGFGRGFFQTASQVLVQAVVEKQEVAVATAIFLASMVIGGAIGATVGGAIWNEKLPNKLAEYLPEANQNNATAIFNSIVVAMKFPVDSPARIAIDQAYRETLQTLAIVATCMTVPMLFFMFFLTDFHLDKFVNRSEEKQKEIQDSMEQGNGAEKQISIESLHEKQTETVLRHSISK